MEGLGIKEGGPGRDGRKGWEWRGLEAGGSGREEIELEGGGPGQEHTGVGGVGKGWDLKRED